MKDQNFRGNYSHFVNKDLDEKLTKKTLYRKISKTAKTRFEAAKRLKYKDKALHYFLAIASVILLSISITTNDKKTIASKTNEVSVAANDNNSSKTTEKKCSAKEWQIFISIIILVLSLLTQAEDYRTRGIRMHDCAVVLNNLSRKIIHLETDDSDELEKIEAKYSDVLQKYENHEDIDFKVMQFKTLGEKDKINWIEKIWIKIIWCLRLIQMPLFFTILLFVINYIVKFFR